MRQSQSEFDTTILQSKQVLTEIATELQKVQGTQVIDNYLLTLLLTQLNNLQELADKIARDESWLELNALSQAMSMAASSYGQFSLCQSYMVGQGRYDDYYQRHVTISNTIARDKAVLVQQGRQFITNLRQALPIKSSRILARAEQASTWYGRLFLAIEKLAHTLDNLVNSVISPASRNRAKFFDSKKHDPSMNKLPAEEMQAVVTSATSRPAIH